jgi:AcrR family transcriptional regulator
MDERLSLRGRQRQLVRDSVLEAALELFSAAGFQKTTMQMIAERAGVGVATVFRHFSNKAAILAALVRRDIEQGFADGQAIIDNPPIDGTEGVTRHLLAMLPIFGRRSKRIELEPYFWLAMPTGRKEIDEVVVEADAGLNRQIHTLLAHYQATGQFRADLNLEDATAVVFHVFNGHYVNFTSGQITSPHVLEQNIRDRIALVLEGWRP